MAGEVIEDQMWLGLIRAGCDSSVDHFQWEQIARQCAAKRDAGDPLPAERLGQVQHWRDSNAAANEERLASGRRKPKSIAEWAEDFDVVTGLEAGQPIGPDADHPMNNVEFRAASGLSPPCERERAAQKRDGRFSFAALDFWKVAFRPIELALGAIANVLIAAGDLDELTRLGMRKSYDLQHEAIVLTTERYIGNNG